MNHTEKFNALNKEALEQFEEYIMNKKEISASDHLRIHSARDEWQLAWTKFQETLLMLEKLEI